jgi:hypothetical protein
MTLLTRTLPCLVLLLLDVRRNSVNLPTLDNVINLLAMFPVSRLRDHMA